MHDSFLIISLFFVALAIFILPYNMPQNETLIDNEITPTLVMIIPSLPIPEIPEIISEREIQNPNFLVSSQSADLTSLIHDKVNQERIDRGLESLPWSKDLANAALLHAQHLAEFAYVSHVDKNGKGPGDRATCYNEEFDSTYVPGENIVQMSTHRGLEYSAQDAVNAWMFSKPHADNIKLPSWTSTGIGTSIGNNGIAYVVQMFC